MKQEYYVSYSNDKLSHFGSTREMRIVNSIYFVSLEITSVNGLYQVEAKMFNGQTDTIFSCKSLEETQAWLKDQIQTSEDKRFKWPII